MSPNIKLKLKLSIEDSTNHPKKQNILPMIETGIVNNIKISTMSIMKLNMMNTIQKKKDPYWKERNMSTIH